MADLVLNVNSWTDTANWVGSGTTPYIDAQDSSYVACSTKSAVSNAFTFEESSDLGTITSVIFSVRALSDDAKGDITLEYSNDNASSWYSFDNLLNFGTSYGTQSGSDQVGSFGTWTLINLAACRMTCTAASALQVDHVYMTVVYTPGGGDLSVNTYNIIGVGETVTSIESAGKFSISDLIGITEDITVSPSSPPGAVSFGGKTVNSAASGASWSCDVPSGFQDGDCWLLVWFKDDDLTPDAIPSGFTKIDEDLLNATDDSSVGACIRYYATAPVSAVAFDNTSDSGESWRVVGYWVRGLDVSSPPSSMIAGNANAGGGQSNTLTPTSPAPSSGGATGDITFSAVAARQDINPATVVQPTGMTTLEIGQNGTAAGDAQAMLAYEDYADDSSHQWSVPDCVTGIDSDFTAITFVLAASSGPANLSINVSEKIGTVETLTDKGSGGKTSLFELVKTIESIVSKMQDLTSPSISDLVRLIENIDAKVSGGKLSQYEIVSIAENITASLSGYNISISDIIGIIENVSSRMSDAYFNISDLVGIIENVVAVTSGGKLSVQEVINIIENINIRMSGLSFSVSDIISVIEDVTASMSGEALQDCEINENDIAAISEAIAIITSDGNFSVSDLTGIIENLSSRMSGGEAEIFDLLGVIENISTLMSAGKFELYEIAGIIESISAKMSDLQISKYELVAIIEDVNSIMSGGYLNSTDLVGVIENILVEVVGGGVYTSDLVKILESIVSKMSDGYFSASELAGIVETVVSKMSDMNISVSELSGITEIISSRMSGGKFTIFDKVAVEESLAAQMSSLKGDRFDKSIIEEYINMIVVDVGALVFSKSELISIIESISIIASSLKRFTIDNVTIQEYINTLISEIPNIGASIFETLATIENVNMLISSLFGITVEKTAISEFIVSKSSDLEQSKYENFAISESVESLVSGLNGAFVNQITVKEYLNMIGSSLFYSSYENAVTQEYLNIVVMEIYNRFLSSYDFAAVMESVIVAMVLPNPSAKSFCLDEKVSSFINPERLTSFYIGRYPNQ